MAQTEHRQHQRPLKHRHRLCDAVSVLLNDHDRRQQQKHNHRYEDNVTAIPTEVCQTILNRNSQQCHQQSTPVRLSEMQNRIQFTECEERQDRQTNIRYRVVDKDGTNKYTYHYPPRLGTVDDLRDIQLWLNLSYGKQNRTHHCKRAEDDGNHQNDLRTLFWEQIS